MSDCCADTCRKAPTSEAERRTLRIALLLNATMFVIGLVAAIIGESTGVLADAFDMLTDAMAYGLSLWAIGRSLRLKARVAVGIGAVLLLLGLGILGETARKALMGSSPAGGMMFAVATLSLIVNITVLRLLGQFRDGDVNLRASYICTRADVMASFGVLVSGVLVLLTHSRFPDLIVGTAIGIYVLKEAAEILMDGRAELREADAIPTA